MSQIDRNHLSESESNSITPAIKERLMKNRYQVNEGQSHIQLDQEYAKATGLGKILVQVCPAHVYSEREDGGIDVEYAACLECGTCRAVADPKLLQWTYPEGSFGVQLRQG